jgi:hypothetical protein
MMRKLASALPATLSLALVACGGGPDIEQIKADFNSPSGSVKSKDGMVAASGSLDASGSAVVVGGGGVPGSSLTASGKNVGLWQINVRRTWEARARAVRDYINGKTTQAQALSEAQVDASGCDSSPEAQAAFEEAFGDVIIDGLNPLGGSKVSGSASYEQDFSACSNGELSGSAKVEVKIELEQQGDGGRFAITVKYGLNNVCELTTDERACLDGTMIVEAEALGSGELGQLTFTSAWELSATWTEAGTERSASLKGGIRSFFEGDGETGSAKIEVINYVNSPEGGEWSYVWSFEGAFNGLEGTATISCRGSDGEVSCTIDENGGVCTGSDGSRVEWTAADEQALDEEWLKG